MQHALVGQDLINDFGGKREVKRPLGRHRLKWEHNIKMVLREPGWGNVDWINLTQDRDQWSTLVNTVIR
jgi:hypothetical protein